MEYCKHGEIILWDQDERLFNYNKNLFDGFIDEDALR